MADHPHQLYAVEFTEAHQARLRRFSCGDETVSARMANEWILGSSVFASRERGTRVWLFETGRGEIVGFGSVGQAKWRCPPPDGNREDVVIIPMLGIDARYQGQPDDPDWRYSNQIMAHLLYETQRIVCEWDGDAARRPQRVVLLVHPDNRRAIRFYERCGFDLWEGVTFRYGNLGMYRFIDV